MSKVIDSGTYAVVGSIKLVLGADSIGYDAPRDRMYVITGGKDVDMQTSILAEIDPRTGKMTGEVPFDAKQVEAMAVEQHGVRLYINVTDKNDMRSSTRPGTASSRNGESSLVHHDSQARDVGGSERGEGKVDCPFQGARTLRRGGFQ